MPVFISSIGTALPSHKTEQSAIADYMVERLRLNSTQENKLRILYRASGIHQRYSVLRDFSENLNGQGFFPSGSRSFPSLEPRMKIYRSEALKLAISATEDALRQLKHILIRDFTHLITVSCTGMYAPGLDIELIETLGLKTSIQRTAVNFMGCYAAFNALKLADHIVTAHPESKVLIICVELCSIHLQENTDNENLLSSSLFGDGAATAIVTSGGYNKVELSFEEFHNDLAVSGKEEMGWYLGDNGFEMKLSSMVPDTIKSSIKTLTENLLQSIDLAVSDIDYFAIHPGGKKILQIIEETLGIPKSKNQFAHDILRKMGNMSSPTVLFVIKSILEKLGAIDHHRRILSFSFGPGLTLESMLLKIEMDV